MKRIILVAYDLSPKKGSECGKADLWLKIISKHLISELIAKDSYALIHCITPAGIHSHNDFYELGVPVIVGPIGGGLKIPPGFEEIFRNSKEKSFLRDWYYAMLVKNKKWKQYFCNANKIIIGTAYLRELLPEKCRGNTTIIFDTLLAP